MTNSTSLFVFLTALLERICGRIRQTPAWQLRYRLALVISLIAGLTQGVQAQVSGTVFQDFNADGTPTSTSITEPGVVGITVTAFNATGTVVGTATTSANGTYTIPGITGAVRVEFSNIPAFYYSGPYGAQNRTSVQFVTGPASGVNFGINNPANYCQSNPKLATSCYLNGSYQGTNPAFVEWDYNNTFNDPNQNGHPTGITELATQSQIGSTYGVAYNRYTNQIFTSSFLKRHVGLPDLNGDGQGDLGNIFVIDATTHSTSLWLNLTTLGLNVGTIGNDASRGLRGLTDPSNDPDAFDKIGKVGLGDLELSDDGKTMYVTNLFDKKLYAIDVATKTIKGSWTVPNTCSNGDVVNFGLKYYQGNVYVGQVCTAQTSQNSSDLKSTVYKFDGTTFTTVIEIPLNYTKGYVYNGGGGNAGCRGSISYWHPWRTTWPPNCVGTIVVYPQPILSDIEFDPSTGNMVVGLRDRLGDQGGRLNYAPTGGTTYEIMAGGDILAASPNGSGTYTLENNGTVGGRSSSGGVGNNEGPGGGEFYVGDNLSTGDHHETSLGGLAILPGSNEIISTVFDPQYTVSGGVKHLSQLNGTSVSSTTLYDLYTPGGFGKANGLGDLEILCSPAPIEIGNRVWKDTDKDGIQDADEPALAGVTVNLYGPDGTSLIGTAITDLNGNYIFSSATGSSTNSQKYGLNLLPNTNYTLSIGSLGTDASVSGLTLNGVTIAPGETASATNTGGTINNNDAFLVGGLPTIKLTTGPNGANNHTYDFGFVATPPTAGLGDYVWLDANKNGIQDAGETPIGGVVVTLYTNGVATAATVTNASGFYSFTGLTPGTSNAYSVGFTAPAGLTATIQQAGGNDVTDSDADPITGRTRSVTLAAGEFNPNLDAGFYLIPASLGDYVFQDNNKNGIQDAGDTPISGVTVTLYTNGTVTATTTTDANGLYSFTGLTPGSSLSYSVGFTTPTGLTATMMGQGTNTALDSDADVTTGRTQSVTLAPGENNPTLDAGFYTPCSLSITPTSTPVLCNNGATGSLTITVTGGTTPYIYSASTGASTSVLSGLTAGTYSLTVTDAFGCTATQTVSLTQPAALTLALNALPQTCVNNVLVGGSVTVSSITGGTAPYTYLTLPGGSTTTSLSGLTPGSYTLAVTDANGCSTTATATVNPAQCALAGLGDYVFRDNNKDGIQNAGDTPIAGVTVTLYTNGTVAATTTTDANGLYSFTGLTPGSSLSYSVGFSTPTGLTATLANAGSNDTLDSDADPLTGRTQSVTLTAGEFNSTLDAGFYPTSVPTAGLGNYVFLDNNQNGIQDAGDTPISSVTVSLFTNGVASATTVTDASGFYSFTGLTPGSSNSYAVGFTTPTGLTATLQQVGGSDVTDSDVNPTTGLTRSVTLAAGEFNPNLRAGFYRKISPSPSLELRKLVDKSVALQGDTLTYTLLLTNTGTADAADVVVRDSTNGLTYLPGTVAAPVATTYSQGKPISLWTVASISPGQSLTLTYQALVDSTGVIYNTATIPGVELPEDTVRVCTSVPIKLCPGDEYILAAPAGRAGYRWYRDGVLILGASTNSLTVTQAGSYSLGLDNAASNCPDFSCCPVLFEIDSLPVFVAVATPATCLGNAPQTNGRLVISGFNPAHTYQYSAGASFNASASLSGPRQTIPASGVLASNLASPAGSMMYTIRVYNGSDCYVDQTVILLPTVCGCPADVCVPYVLSQTRRARRIGDPIR